MNHRIVTKNDRTYLEYLAGGRGQVATERDATGLVQLCAENGSDRLLLHAGDLSPDFFDLSTGVAGAILLKFAIYRLKVALVASPELTQRGKFREMMLETNRGNAFRVFPDPAQAEAWLLQEQTSPPTADR